MALKLFISQAMTGRKESEVRHERWFYYELAKLRWGSPSGDNIELINQFDAPDDMPIFEGSTTEERETKQSLWLLGRSIQMMKDADIVIMVGNPIESKGMMVEYEVIRQYNKSRWTWGFHTDKSMIEWSKENCPNEFIDIMHTYTSYCSNNYGEVTMKEDKPKGSSYGTYYINPKVRALPDDETVASVINEWIQSQLPIGNVYVHDLHTNGDAIKWNFKTASASKSVWLQHTDYSLYVISDGDPRDNLSNTRSCITIGPYGIGYYNKETFTDLTEEDFESLFDHLRKSFKLYPENE